MGKKFMGLDGTDHFWDRAKAWILDQITSAGIDKQSIIDTVYPVGSLYWSSKDTDPSTLFGGTWVQIKDRFVLACGDTYNTTGATGGASTVTLSVENMPSHNHTFTPSGTITMNSHSHGLNNHTHSFSGGTDSPSKLKRLPIVGDRNGNNSTITNLLNGKYMKCNTVRDFRGELTNHDKPWAAYAPTADVDYQLRYFDISHNHSFSGTTGGNSGETTSVTSTGSFSGTQGTTSSDGSGTAFSIIPPYVVKYCWERTA